MLPLVSIIIPAYNAERFIRETIISALYQSWPSKEIIVVDDGSSDSTHKIARLFEKDGVRLFTQINRGASAARNKGFKESCGHYIQFLDADDLMESNKIAEQMKRVDLEGDHYLYAGKWKLFYDQPEKNNFCPNELWQDFNDPAEWLVTAWTKQIWMHPSVWLTPRNLIENAGPWDETLSLHDDGEFFSRVILQSKGIRFCNNSESYYRKGINNSLSSTLSLKAINSHYKICQLYEHHLLNYKNSNATQKACATNYLAFYYAHFPGYKLLRDKARRSADRLGGSDLTPQGTHLFRLLKNLFGWKFAKRMEKFYYGNGINRASIKKKITLFLTQSLRKKIFDP